jgi:hypothetical protein
MAWNPGVGSPGTTTGGGNKNTGGGNNNRTSPMQDAQQERKSKEVSFDQTDRSNPYSQASKTAMNNFNQGISNRQDDRQRNAVLEQIKLGKIGQSKLNPSFFDSGLGKIIKTVGLGVIAPQLLAGTKVGALYSGYNKAKGIANLAKSFNITDKNVVTSLADTVKDKFAGFNTTGITGPKGPPSDREGGEGNQQNALMSEYLLLLQKMEQGVLQAEGRERLNILKSRLGKADGGIMNINMNKGKPGEVLSKLGELLYG